MNTEACKRDKRKSVPAFSLSLLRGGRVTPALKGYFSRLMAIAYSLSLLGLVVGCPGMKDSLKHQFPPSLKIYYTAATYGSMYPCGCRIPEGGLSRRATVLAQEKEKYPLLIVDAGSFVPDSSRYGRFAGGWILKACLAMGYHAINIGMQEARVPVTQLREWSELSGNILISANVRDSEGMPVTRTYIIHDIGEIRVGITGIAGALVQPAGAAELPNIVVPVEPLKEVMEEFKRNRVDFVVLLADTIEDEIKAILKEVPEIDFVVQGQGFTRIQRAAATLVGETRIVRIGDQGKVIGWTRFDFEPDGTILGEESSFTALDPSVAYNPDIEKLLLEFKTELKARRDDFMGDPGNPFQRPATYELVDILSGFAGQNHCLSCHPGFSLDEDIVGHGGAWLKLSEENRTNPACLPCHTTGYGLATGLQDVYRDNHLINVTCEACHGPGALHVREQTILRYHLDESFLLPPEDPVNLPFRKEVPMEVCLKCHTKEWSPNFDYKTWVTRVNHSSIKNISQGSATEAGNASEESSSQ